MSHLRIRHWAATHRGTVRSVNQDALLCRPDIGLFAVADGAGGHQDGDFAAQSTLDHLARLPPGCAPAALVAEVRSGSDAAHRNLRAIGQARRPRAVLATTLVVLLVHKTHFACLWAGDSRCYLLRDGALRQLTTDHSLVQALIDSGDISEAEADAHPHGNVITRAIGAGDPNPTLDKSSGTLLTGDRLLLCSDGVSKSVPAARMAELLELSTDPAADLIDAAMRHGTRDNVTAIVLLLDRPA
jgi:serine/threonine protein phosphatase PrpC